MLSFLSSEMATRYCAGFIDLRHRLKRDDPEQAAVRYLERNGRIRQMTHVVASGEPLHGRGT